MRRPLRRNKDVNLHAASTLSAAAAELQGPIIRTSASVIGQRDGESIIFATTGWGYTVTVMMHAVRIGFEVRPRGWLRKSLHIAGAPADLVAEILDPDHHLRLLALHPMLVELTPTGLRLEHKYGTDVTAAIHLAASIARRSREVQEKAAEHRFAVPA